MILTRGTKPIVMREMPHTKKPIRMVSTGDYCEVEVDADDTKRIKWLREKGFNELQS